MKNNLEKSLERVNKKGIWAKIRQFFKVFFIKEEKNMFINAQPTDIEVNNDIQKQQFMEYIKNVEDEETKLLKLQQQYRNGKIKEEELTQSQIKSLCDLYDKQIEELQRSNRFRKERIKQLRKK